MTTSILSGPRRSAPREFLSAVSTIMVKELRSRMRGRRAFIVLTVYLAILALITYGVYVVVAPSARSVTTGMQANASALIGQSIFTLLSVFQLILVCFIAPAFTAGQISLEREKQTLDLLVSTPMRPGAIVIGKLAAALAFVVLMILAAVPITAIVLMYGGAAIDDILRQQLVLLATALALGTIGVFFSALLKRTQAATVLTYITMLVLTLGTAMVFTFWTIVANQNDGGFGIGTRERAPEQILYLNPGVAMLDVVANIDPGGFGSLASILAQLRGETLESRFVGEECFGNVCRPVDQFGNPQPDVIASGGNYWWPRIAISFIVVSALLTLASMRLVAPTAMRWAFRRRPALATPADGRMAGSGTEPSTVIEELAESER